MSRFEHKNHDFYSAPVPLSKAGRLTGMLWFPAVNLAKLASCSNKELHITFPILIYAPMHGEGVMVVSIDLNAHVHMQERGEGEDPTTIRQPDGPARSGETPNHPNRSLSPALSLSEWGEGEGDDGMEEGDTELERMEEQRLDRLGQEREMKMNEIQQLLLGTKFSQLSDNR